MKKSKPLVKIWKTAMKEERSVSKETRVAGSLIEGARTGRNADELDEAEEAKLVPEEMRKKIHFFVSTRHL